MDMKKAFGLLTSIACVYFTSTDAPFKASRGTGSKVQHSDPSLPRKYDVTQIMRTFWVGWLVAIGYRGGRSLSNFRLSYIILVQKPGGDGSVFVILLRGRECKLQINF